MEKRTLLKSWAGNVIGLIIASVTIPFVFKPDPASQEIDLSTYALPAAIVGTVLSIFAIFYFRKNIVPKYWKSCEPSKLMGAMTAWSMVAFLPFGAGLAYYTSTNNIQIYIIICALSVLLKSLFWPLQKSI